MKNRDGFTLTELLAVVIIIGILTGLSLGGFRQAFERSHFSEGLQAGSALNGAVSRHYYDNLNDETKRTNPTLAELDVSVSNPGTCRVVSTSSYPVCVRTKYFEVYYNPTNQRVYALRVKNNTQGAYAIAFYPDFTSRRSMEKCVPINNSPTGTKLCQSLGYTQVQDGASMQIQVGITNGWNGSVYAKPYTN